MELKEGVFERKERDVPGKGHTSINVEIRCFVIGRADLSYFSNVGVLMGDFTI